MKHFIGGSALGLFFAFCAINAKKKCTEMSNLELSVFIGAHFFVSGLFGLIAWGLLP